MNKEIVSFNSGEMTEKTDALTNVEKYESGCRHLENMLPRIYGSAERRPGTEFIDRGRVITEVPFLVYPTLHELARELPSIVSYEYDELSYENSTVESGVEEENRVLYEGKYVYSGNKQVFYFGVGSTGRQSSHIPIPDLAYHENESLCWENETVRMSGEIVFSRNIVCYENDTLFYGEDIVVGLVEILKKPEKPVTTEIHEVFYDETTPNLANRELVTYEDDPVFYYENWSTVTDYAEFQAMEKNRKYRLINDIDLVGETWTPIVNFSGTLDGKDFTISNLTINTPTTDYRGIFSNLITNAVIKNLNFDSCTITGDDYVSVLAGRINNQSNITIENVAIANSSVTGDDNVAPLVGYLDTNGGVNFFSCSATNCTISADKWAGGLIGEWYNGGSSTTPHDNCVECYADNGTTVAGYSSVGGFCGNFDTGTTVGYNYINIHTCYSDVNITKTYTSDMLNVAGFVGSYEGCKLTSCYSSGDISLTTDDFFTSIGGFVGTQYQVSIVINCYSTSFVTVTQVSADTIYDVGGFAGQLDSEDNIMLRCYCTGDVEINSLTAFPFIYNIGGFMGQDLGPTTAVEIIGDIQRCFSWSQVHIDHLSNTLAFGGHGIGGFTGGFSNFAAAYLDCYSWTGITVDTKQAGTSSYVAGFAATNTRARGDTDVVDCYSTQTESEFGSDWVDQLYDGGTNEVGGFGAYFVTYDLNASNCFWDTTTSSITEDASNGAIGYTTAEMMTKSNLTDWDFDNIWEMVEL